MIRDTPRTATTRPLRRDAERNRQRMIAAAREVFRERGFETTLDDVAAKAGLGVGTVYRRFPNKEHLVEAMFAERLDEIGELAQEALKRGDAWQAFTDFLWHAAESIAADRGLHDVMVSKAFGHERVAEARDRLVPLVQELVDRAQRSGCLRKDFEPQDMIVLFKMLGAAAQYTHPISDDLWKRYFALVLDSLRGRPEPPSRLPVKAPDIEILDNAMNHWCK
ncbi:TetR/AcrR family transcriptional regulator [Amycolatopsis acidicola]|uniref:TetR/AcrR family transcriptional regulator n=1 Tax=Amycolatopsis acidicola TaxID=2596893 RepID=A0A5N0UWB2_9PSEU|nr:TetR/AcrR family transcriptional regulator [Amycolatopsis acidicola]KAA9155162.1 TetR/AcrR family transcriptional regulator [Amycolatopsis acidicola]